jgi:hypothetical protein
MLSHAGFERWILLTETSDSVMGVQSDRPLFGMGGVFTLSCLFQYAWHPFAIIEWTPQRYSRYMVSLQPGRHLVSVHSDSRTENAQQGTREARRLKIEGHCAAVDSRMQEDNFLECLGDQQDVGREEQLFPGCGKR